MRIPFTIVEPDCEENTQESIPARELVQLLALQKAQSVAYRFPEAQVLGGDTLIEIDGKLLGKPQNLKGAADMLGLLSGRLHQVHSGIALVCLKNDRLQTDIETTSVQLKKLSEDEIQAYLKTGESLGKAGAYCIQEKGAALIEKISGDYPTIVGLPLRKVAKHLENAGATLPAKVEEIYSQQAYPNWGRFQSE